MEARQQSWPRIWLMTDERLGDRLWEAVARLPEGAGIVLRHYSLTKEARATLAVSIAGIAERRAFTLAVAADVELAQQVGAALVHNPAEAAGELPFSRSVHNLEDAEAARFVGAALVFVSPVYATRSHPGEEPLGHERAMRVARAAEIPAIALGGMNAQKFAPLERGGFYGWAGIDAWL